MKIITRNSNFYIYNGIYLDERLKSFFIEFSNIYNSIRNLYINDYQTQINELNEMLTATGKEFDAKCIELSFKGADIVLAGNEGLQVIAEDGELKSEVRHTSYMKFSDFYFNLCSFDEDTIKELDLYLEKTKNANIPCVFLPKSIEHEYNTYLEVHKKLDLDVQNASKKAEEYKKNHIFATEATSKKYKTLIDNYRFANETLMDYEMKNEAAYETGMNFQELTYEKLVLIKEIYKLFEKFGNLVKKLDSKKTNMRQQEYNFFKWAGEETIEKMISCDSKWLDEIEYAKVQLFKIHLKKCLKENDRPSVVYEEHLGFSTDAVESFITVKKEEIDFLGYILLDKIDEGILYENKDKFKFKTLKKKINGSDFI